VAGQRRALPLRGPHPLPALKLAVSGIYDSLAVYPAAVSDSGFPCNSQSSSTGCGPAGAGFGTVFSLGPPSAPQGAWVQRVLYRFDGRNGGSGEVPLTNLVGSGGMLYGATGTIPTAFSLAPPATAGGAWTESVLCPASVLGSNQPRGNMIISPGTGMIYGASPFGGSSQACGSSGCGTVWALEPPASAGGAWAFEALHSFESTDGALPYGGVSRGAGSLFGATPAGGTYNAGTVFAIVE